MTIDEAIEILQLELHSAVNLSTHDSKDAIRLGIEALKMVQGDRLASSNPIFTPLKGETVASDSP